MMTLGDFFGGFLGALGGVGIGVAILSFLSEKLIGHQLEKALAEHQHALNEKLASIGADILRVNDVLSRRNEREFEVVAEAWERMIEAVGMAQGNFGASHVVIDFRVIDDTQVLRVIEELDFPEVQKERLRQASSPRERYDLYAEYDLIHCHLQSSKEWAKFKNLLSVRQIFMSAHIFTGFAEIRDELHHVLTKVFVYLGRDPMPVKERVEISRVLAVDLNAKIDKLGALIRTRFGFGDEGSP